MARAKKAGVRKAASSGKAKASKVGASKADAGKAEANKPVASKKTKKAAKIEKKKVPARPAQKGVRNPFTGELQDRPAKPAYNKVKVLALKALKSMA